MVPAICMLPVKGHLASMCPPDSCGPFLASCRVHVLLPQTSCVVLLLLIRACNSQSISLLPHTFMHPEFGPAGFRGSSVPRLFSMPVAQPLGWGPSGVLQVIDSQHHVLEASREDQRLLVFADQQVNF